MNVSKAALVGMVFEAAKEYVPLEELDMEQRWKLERITCRVCRCSRCKLNLESFGEGSILYDAHADKETLEIGFSSELLRVDLALDRLSLNRMIQACLHEVVHILYPDYGEKETEWRSFRWMRRGKWIQDLEERALPIAAYCDGVYGS